MGHAFTVCIRTEKHNQMSFYPFILHEISVLIELIFGHLRYLLTDVPRQPNFPPDHIISCRRRRFRFQRLLHVMSVAPPADRPIGCRRRRFSFQRLPTPQGGVGGFAVTGGWVSSWIPTHMLVGGQWRFRWRDR